MRPIIPTVVFLLTLLAFSGTTNVLAQDAITFSITPLNGSGITGTGTVTPGPGADESTHIVQWEGLAPNTVHAVTQYHGTSCESLDGAPEFVFNTLTADSQGKAAASLVVKKPFANWPRRPHFLILHAEGDPSTQAVACGMIVAQAPASATPAASAPPAPAPSPGAQESIAFSITPVAGSGITGSGTVTAGPGADESTHVVQWQGLTPGAVHAVTQYHGTNCESLDAAPEFVFNTVTADSQGKAAASIVVKKPFANWPRRPHFLLLHAEPDAATAAVACGAIIAQTPASPAPAASPTAATPAAPMTSAPAAGGAPAADPAAVPQSLPDTGRGSWPLEMILLGGAALITGIGVAGRLFAARRLL